MNEKEAFRKARLAAEQDEGRNVRMAKEKDYAEARKSKWAQARGMTRVERLRILQEMLADPAGGDVTKEFCKQKLSELVREGVSTTQPSPLGLRAAEQLAPPPSEHAAPSTWLYLCGRGSFGPTRLLAHVVVLLSDKNTQRDMPKNVLGPRAGSIMGIISNMCCGEKRRETLRRKTISSRP